MTYRMGTKKRLIMAKNVSIFGLFNQSHWTFLHFNKIFSTLTNVEWVNSSSQIKNVYSFLSIQFHSASRFLWFELFRLDKFFSSIISFLHFCIDEFYKHKWGLFGRILWLLSLYHKTTWHFNFFPLNYFLFNGNEFDGRYS